jgi:hypothetical protein
MHPEGATYEPPRRLVIVGVDSGAGFGVIGSTAESGRVAGRRALSARLLAEPESFFAWLRLTITSYL